MQLSNRNTREVIDSMVKVDDSEFRTLIAQVADVKLRLALEDSANDGLAQATEQAFIAGWKCAKQPELLVFKQEGAPKLTIGT